jgi:hypothetical protein
MRRLALTRRGQRDADVPPDAAVEPAPLVWRPALVKRQANDLIRATAGGEPGRIPFLCECASEGCYRTVWLTGTTYDTAHADEPVLAPGHEAA